ncbi:argininosuccinate lyase [Desulfonauticus submarinus]
MPKKEKKLWGGRFDNNQSPLVEEYTQSVEFDFNFFQEDIQGSIAHAKMLAEIGILTPQELNLLIQGLEKIQAEIETGVFEWKKEFEDVHMNIEKRLIELVGDVGKKLHTGRSRNDQVALDFRLYVAKAVKEWQEYLRELITALVKVASKNKDTLLPGFTHLQPAQPVSLAQHLLAYAWMFKRDFERIQDALKRIEVSPLGAAALAGSAYALNPDFVAKEIGFRASFNNSMDAVSDRDFVLESLFIASVIQAHLSRLCEEIILWSNPCFGFVLLPDEFATGSSIMPQKKNPDVAEIMRGKTGRIYGNLVSLLTVVKGLPLTYNRDLQEDKEPFLDTHKTISLSLILMKEMFLKLKFQQQNMLKAIKKGFLNATELADYLVLKGVPFREAHHISGRLVKLAENKNISLEELSLEEMKKECSKIEEDVFEALDYKQAIQKRNIKGGTAPKSVEFQLNLLKEWIKKNGGSV